ERNADHQKERECKHLDRRMAADKISDRAGKEHHSNYRNNDRADHYVDAVLAIFFADHADRGYYRIERKNDVEQRYLYDHAGERRMYLFELVPLFAFERTVYLVRRFCDQEQSADQQDQIAAGNAVSENGEQVRGQTHDPRKRKQK